jgi:hypothetical protein
MDAGWQGRREANTNSDDPGRLVKWLGRKAGKEWFDTCFACFEEEGGKEQAGG